MRVAGQSRCFRFAVCVLSMMLLISLTGCGAPKAAIKIAVAVPLSALSAEGINIRRAAELAVAQLDGPLVELGYQVKLVSYDDKMKTDTAAANAEKIIADSEVLCGVGHYGSNTSIVASDVYHRGGLAFISPSSTDSELTQRGYSEISRVIGRQDFEGIAAARFAKAQGVSTAYVIQVNRQPFRRNGEYFQSEAGRLGIKVVGVFTLERSYSIEDILAPIVRLDPDMIYFAGLGSEASRLFHQARVAGYMGTLFSAEGSSTVAELGGPRLTEGGGAYYTDMIAPVSEYPTATQFAKDFEARYGAPPLPFAAHAYDATGICLKALEQAMRANRGALPTRAEVAQEVRALTGYRGVVQTYSFTKNGDPVSSMYFLYKVTSANPAKWAQNPIVDKLEILAPE